MKILPLLVASFIAIIFCSCSQTIHGWRSQKSASAVDISFNYLNGKATDTVRLDQDNEFRLHYTAGGNSGELKVTLHNDNKAIWQTIINGPVDSAISIPIDHGGLYKLTLQGKKASGNYVINYARSAKKHVQVMTNKNIELFGLMLQLDNGPDVLHNNDTVTIYGKRVPMSVWYVKTCANYLRYKAFDSCAVMRAYRAYQAKGFYNDFFIGFLLETDQVPNARLNAGTDEELIAAFSAKADLKEGKRNATAFLDLLNDFYRQVHFDTYLKENEPFYAQARANVEKCLPPDNFIPVMEAFYQKSFNGYYLVPSLNVPSGMGFGKLNRVPGKIYNTFGPFTLQSFDPKNPSVGYNDPQHIRDLSVHEFGHSFVNPAVDHTPDTLIRSSAYLFEPIRTTMTKLSYPGWRICLYESFVRAGEVLIARKLGTPATADRIMKDNMASGFIYLPAIVTELEKYSRDIKIYPSYDAYVPLVLEKLKQIYPKKG